MMKLKDVLLAISIIILTIFVTFYGINTLFPKPQYEDFCDDQRVPMVKRDVCPTVCVPMYYISVENNCIFNECGSGCGPDGVSTFETIEECELVLDDYVDPKECYEDVDEARKDRGKYVFLIALPLGIIIVLLGAFKFGLEAVGTGLMGGGVGTLIYGSGAYWPYTQNWIRFLLSLLGLIVLIWFSYYFSKKKK